jgi:hypothetical protein
MHRNDWYAGATQIARLFSPSVLVLLLACSCSRAIPAATTDLQALINAAKPGDTIVLPAGSLYTGNFILPAKSGDGTITITSSEVAELAENVRVKPSDRNHMAVIRSVNSGAIFTTAPGAHNYRLVGLELYADAAYNYGILQLGANEDTLEKLPSHFEMDRLYIHGDSKMGSKRGIALNGISMSVRNCYISEFMSPDQDTQAIGGWNGAGPFQIVNNYLEAAGENIMFGGSTPSVKNLVPSDIEIRGNYFYKPLSWKRGDPSFTGTGWSVKNLLELKNARRVKVSGNIFENNWSGGQTGFALVFTVRTQDDTAPWSVVEDVTFEDNILRNVESGLVILGQDGSGRSRRIMVRNNQWDVKDTLFQILNGAEDVTIDHNTALNPGPPLRLDGPPMQRLIFKNNICLHSLYGFNGSGIAMGVPTLQHFAPDAIVLKNIIVGADAKRYPADNFYPPQVDNVVFRDRAHNVYQLAAKSPYRNAGTDGQDIGADTVRIRQATAATLSGKQEGGSPSRN